jgi:ribosomal protein L35
MVASGKISKSFRKHMSNMKGEYETKELQNTAILSTAHELWKVQK